MQFFYEEINARIIILLQKAYQSSSLAVYLIILGISRKVMIYFEFLNTNIHLFNSIQEPVWYRIWK